VPPRRLPKGGVRATPSQPPELQTGLKLGATALLLRRLTRGIIDASESGLSSDVPGYPSGRSFPLLRHLLHPSPTRCRKTGTLLLLRDRIYVPIFQASSSSSHLYTTILVRTSRCSEDAPAYSRRYYWPRLTSYIQQYVHACSHAAGPRVCSPPYGPLRFLPTTSPAWESISMDHIEGLPMSSGMTRSLSLSAASPKWLCSSPLEHGYSEDLSSAVSAPCLL